MRPLRLTTILPARRSSICSNSPMYPCSSITSKKRTITFDEGRIITWRLPRFSALLMFFSASAKTEVRTILRQTERAGEHDRRAGKGAAPGGGGRARPGRRGRGGGPAHSGG